MSFSREQFWRFAITGCENNSELKVWSCERWNCLQTIRFSPSPSSNKSPVLKAGMDLSAGYLILSDIYNKVLYVLSLFQSNEKSVARVISISEFLLPCPILSFVIVEAGQSKARSAADFLMDHCTAEEESEEEQLTLKMFIVQPKSLQECNITFRPQITSNPLADKCGSLEVLANGENGQAEPNHEHSGLNLMTPDAFSSPAKKETAALDSSPDSPELLNAEVAKIAMQEQAPPSGGSSPSREVRDILCLAQDDIVVLEDMEQTEEELKDKPEAENWSDIPLVLLKEKCDGLKNDEIAKVERSIRAKINTYNGLCLVSQLFTFVEIKMN